MIELRADSIKKAALFFCVLFFLGASSFFYELRPASAGSGKIFVVSPGDGFFETAKRLKKENLIRSTGAFEIYALLTGKAWKIKPGTYEISGNMSSGEIAGILSESADEVEITVLDGASVYDIDAILSSKKILAAGALISYSEKNSIEGKLYPDTYRFFEHSSAEIVVGKFLENFAAKTDQILKKDPINYNKNLILASLVQKEVPGESDSRIVAGILKKRLAVGMKLDVDATICYLKKKAKPGTQCYPLSQADFKIDSPYNTYLKSGLPPGPIGSPNAAAISAVLNSIPSPYWFYLSDPKTGKTVFSKTLDEQNANRAVYLR